LGKFYDAMQKANAPDGSAPKDEESARAELTEGADELFRIDDEHIQDQASVGAESTTRSIEDLVRYDRAGESDTDEAASDHAEPMIRIVDSEGSTAPEDYRPAPEEFRRLRTDVFRRPPAAAYERIIQKLFAFRRSPRESGILFASAVPGEGTSTVALSTALALAQHRTEKVVLIDANLRSPSLHKAFGIDVSVGLGDVLLGSTPVTTAVNNEISPGLSLLTAGGAKESPAQLLTVASFQGIVVALMSLYDWIIIDSPPATTYPDVATIAAVAGGAMLVVEAEKTRQEVVEEAKRILDVSDAALLGAVLNRRRFHIPDFLYKRL
jgi:capsular exopolysaccharide synthesis family protein